MTLKQNIINALNALRFRTNEEYFHLNKIYDEVSKITDRADEQLKHSIRGTMETNSSDSTSFNGRTNIFSLREKGTGMWKLNKYDNREDIDNLIIGEIYTMSDIMKAFKVSGQRGIMKSNTHNCLVLLSKNSNGTYADDPIDDGKLMYTGEGQEGDQEISGSNYTLYYSLRLDVSVYLFVTVGKGQHKYYGEVYLYSNPTWANEADRKGNMRKVLKFPLQIRNNIAWPDETYKNNPNYDYILKTIEEIDHNLDISIGQDNNIRIDNTPLRLRSFKPIEDRKKQNRSVSPDYIANEIIKDTCGKLNEKAIYEMEIQKMMQAEVAENIEKMRIFYENKKENEGYDILSFEKNEEGKYVEKYIEVKSTKGGEETPIDITENELYFAKQHKEHYYIYRIIKSDSPDRYLKIIPGDPEENYRIEPVTFRIYAKD